MKWHIPLCYGISIYLMNVVRPERFINEDEYDNVYMLHEHKCSYTTVYQNQYQKSLVKWEGNGFYIWCTKRFIGQNRENVVTDYTVCFNVLDYYISDCNVKVEYIHIARGWEDVKRSFSCNEQIPKQWCIDHEATLRIETDKNTPSYLRLEVTVKADVNLSITACLLIVAAIAGFILFISFILLWKWRKGKRSEGRVIRMSTDPGTSGAEIPLVSYPTTVMEPVGKGKYVPRSGVIQVHGQNIASHQVTSPVTRSVTPTAAPSVDSSVPPPPSYQECT